MSDWAVSRASHLFVLSGPSGVGKDTVISALLECYPDLHYAVTATTRPARPGEQDGKNYYFVSQADYYDMLSRDELLAPATVHGHLYGAPIRSIARALQSRQDVLLKVDVQGALQVRRKVPHAILMFLAPASTDDLMRRLRARHTESPDELDRRLQDARQEMLQIPRYDYIVENVNAGLALAVDKLCCIISAERSRVHQPPLDLTFR